MAGHWFRYAAWCFRFVGALCWYCALFLHEDEEGRFQSRIEEWWIRVSDAQSAALSHATAFTQAVARMSEIVFDRVFGRKLISLRLFGVSIYFSLASFFLFAAVAPVVSKSHHPPLGSAMVPFLVFCAAGLLPAIVGGDLPFLYWVVAPFGIFFLRFVGFIAYVWRIRGWEVVGHGVLYILICFGTSFLFDLIYIATTRWMLRKISERGEIYEIPLMIAGNIILLMTLVAGPVNLGVRLFQYAPQIGVVVTFSFMLNTLNFLVGSVALLLATLLLLHKLLWPLLERFIYSIQRFAPLGNKKFLWISGWILIAFPTTLSLEWVRSLVDKLAP